MYLISLAWSSLWNRRMTALLTVGAIALSVALLMTVERVRLEARASFASTVSGTDLIVGARSGSVNLLLYSIFRIGNATNNVRWESYQHFAQHPHVQWAIPLSLGDSHRGYRVLGTTPAYFEHYRYGYGQALRLAQGRAFGASPFEVVLGAEVAKALHYRLGDLLVLAHGMAKISLVKHEDNPFRVVGILAPTGTPVDRTLHVALSGIEAIHSNWHEGIPAPRAAPSEANGLSAEDLTPKTITAFLLGLTSKISTFALQRAVNGYSSEPLLAILPGVALQELWGLMAPVEQALLLISVCVVLVGLIGMLTALLASLNERRREMAILRAVGARPVHIAGLLVFESALLAGVGLFFGMVFFYGVMGLLQQSLQDRYGLYLPLTWPSLYEWAILGAIWGGAWMMGLIPAYWAYRQSLVDGLSVRA